MGDAMRIEMSELGLAVFPCDPATKRPLVPGGFKSRSADPDDVLAFWEKHPGANIGYVPADVGAIGVDIDNGGVECAKDLIGVLGDPWIKLRSRKANRFHLLYPYEGPAVPNGAWTLESGSGEIRHGNGYLIAWTPQALIQGLRTDKPAPLPPDLIKYLASRRADGLDAYDEMTARVRSAAPGSRNNALNAVAWKALRGGFPKAVVVRVLRHAALKAGLPPEEVDKTLESASEGARDAGSGEVSQIEDAKDGLASALSALGYEMRYNVRADRAELRKDDPTHNVALEAEGWEQANGRLIAHLRCQMEERFRKPDGKPYKLNDARWRQLWTAVQHQRDVDPFLEWLKDLPEWDGKPRCRGLLPTLFGAEENDLVWHVSQSIPMAAAWRALKPGYKHDEMPILIGPQGCGKSTFCRELMPPEHAQRWFGDGLVLTDDPKVRVEHTLGKVIVEVSELVGLGRAEVESLKAYLSAREDNVRLAYRSDPETIPRRFILIGTANDSGAGVLPNDPTGLRRFLPVRVRRRAGVAKMVEVLSSVREQIWAEAWHRVSAGEAPRLPESLRVEHAEIAEQFRSGNALLEEQIDHALTEMPATEFTLRDLCAAIGADRRQEKLVIAELTKRGFVVSQKRVDGARKRVWTRKVAHVPGAVPGAVPAKNP